MTIRRIEFDGLQTLSEAYTRGIVLSREGQNFLRDQVARDVRELLRTRKFINAIAEPRVEDGQVVITFVLREKPQLTAVSVVGNFELEDDELFGVLPLPGGPLDRYELDRGAEALVDLYREKGYLYATVELDEAELASSNRAIYRIVEGPQVRVQEILFDGNREFTDLTLRRRVQTAEFVPIFVAGAFDEEQAETDALTIEQFYREEGYLDARVGFQLEFTDVERSDLTLRFVIEEGIRYSVESIALVGNVTFSEAELREQIRLAPGDFLRAEPLRRSIDSLRDLYGEIGFVEVRVTPDEQVLTESGRIDLTFTIDEGPRSKVGEVIIRGNFQTHDKVIRREIELEPGQDFNTLALRRSQRNLQGTTLFTRATVTPLEDEEGYRPALVEVEEGDAVLFLFGAGVSTDSGLLGSISITNRNFDIFDWPRTSEEFIRGRSFRGAGQTLRAQVEPGSELTRLRVEFTEPYLFDRNLRFSTGFFLFERGRVTYDEARLGAFVSLGRRFRTGPLEGWAVEGAFRLQNVDINDLDPLAAREVREAEGGNFLTSFKGTIVRDTTDNRFFPTEGYRLSFSYEQFVGSETFGKPIVGYNWYRTVRTDVLDRKSVLAARANVGWIVGDAPLYERYYGGGFGSIRGFAFRGISPRNGIQDDPVGGEFVIVTGAEYSVPLYGQNIRGVTFLDMGTVEESVEVTSWRVTIGFGLRIFVDLFGRIPIVLDFGIPLAEEEDDDTQVFNFSFGASF